MYKRNSRYEHLFRVLSGVSSGLIQFIEFYIFYVLDDDTSSISEKVTIGGFDIELKERISSKPRKDLSNEEKTNADILLRRSVFPLKGNLDYLDKYLKSTPINPQSFQFEIKNYIKIAQEKLYLLTEGMNCLEGDCLNHLNSLIEAEGRCI